MEAIENLYKRFIAAWNAQDAKSMSELTTVDCIMIGFDGSQMIGRNQIEKDLGKIFKDHQTSSYVTIVRSVYNLSQDVALLHSVVGMVPPGKDDIKPDVNAIQLLTAKFDGKVWLIAGFQNTPAVFHGRPELNEALTKELQNKLKSQ